MVALARLVSVSSIVLQNRVTQPFYDTSGDTANVLRILSMIFLGLDPGLATTGYGVIKKEKNNLRAVEFGAILTPAKTGLAFRLELLSSDLKQIIKKHRPEAVAIEKLFFCKNVKTALDVGHARGVLLLEIARANLPLYEFTPLQVKQAASGYGKASKLQIQKMVQTILHLKNIPKPDDAADALAIAITLANSPSLLKKNSRH